MILKQKLIRLEDWHWTELERISGVNPVAPLIRKIIGDWLGLDGKLQKEQILEEIEGLAGQINQLNQRLKDLEVNENICRVNAEIEADRQEYLNSHQDVLEMYKNKSISPKGYLLLQANLGFKNKDEVKRWLDQCIDEVN